jgi:hypothetical protein
MWQNNFWRHLLTTPFVTFLWPSNPGSGLLVHPDSDPIYRKSLLPPQSEHPAFQNMGTLNFFFSGGGEAFVPSWIRIRIGNPDAHPSPETQSNPDPVRIRFPKQWTKLQLGITWRLSVYLTVRKGAMIRNFLLKILLARKDNMDFVFFFLT